MENKSKSLFDHLNGITSLKTKWENLSEADRKTFSPYMINRFLSMNSGLTELVDELQKYTINVLSPREVYKLYSDLLPKEKSFFKYIKGSKEEKYPDKLVDLVSRYYECSNKEAVEYIDILIKKDELKAQLISILKAYGLDDKEIKKLIK
jgi:hypothetical protein